MEKVSLVTNVIEPFLFSTGSTIVMNVKPITAKVVVTDIYNEKP